MFVVGSGLGSVGVCGNFVWYVVLFGNRSVCWGMFE